MEGSRRTRQQQALRRDVLDAALEQLDAGGSSALNWRALARAVGVSPSALYTYFDSLDALYTALIVDVYEHMAAEVRRAADSNTPPLQRIRATATAYRNYATTHPSRFTLVFTDVLPGYAAPAGGPTIDAQVEVMRPMIESFGELLGEAGIDADRWRHDRRTHLVLAWSQLHGFVSLEVNHHLVWIDDVDATFDAMIDALLDAIVVGSPAG